MSDDERDDAFRALGRVRDSQIADLLTLVVGIAAEKNPEQLRAALEQVFDLTPIQYSHDRMMLTLANAQKAIERAAQLIRELERQLDQIECRLQLTSGAS